MGAAPVAHAARDLLQFQALEELTKHARDPRILRSAPVRFGPPGRTSITHSVPARPPGVPARLGSFLFGRAVTREFDHLLEG
jgi:hypothetical protein